MRWGSYIMANLVFEGETFTCDADSYTCFTTGDQVLALYDLGGRDGKYGLTFHYWMLLMLVLIYMLLAIVALRLKAFKISH